MSETDFCRDKLAAYCTGNGCDLGFGGYKPMVPHAICVDRPDGDPRRAKAKGEWPTHLGWDIFSRLPFEDNTLDFIASSHALEDAQDTARVLREWMRVLKVGGRLVLFLPDQATYEAHCRKSGGLPNQAHVHKDFSLAFVKARLPEGCRVVLEQWPWEPGSYSFALVVEKVSGVSATLEKHYRDKMYED